MKQIRNIKMNNYKITVLPGDGIGPEIINQAIKVLDACAEKFDFKLTYDYKNIGAESIDKFNSPLTDDTINSCLNADAILLGAVGDPKFDNNPNAKVRPEQGLLKLRKTLDLFTNIRPIKIYSELSNLSPLKEKKLNNTDIVIYRELSSGLYFGERKSNSNEASDLCFYSKEEIIRVSKLAFEAAKNRRNKICLVDKANVLDTSRLWRKTVQEISKDYPEVEVNYIYIDNAAMQLVVNPSQFDVILTENMFGDILSDLASVLPGSLGLIPSSSIGTKTALFEPCHGSFPQAKGLDKANPIATILSVAMMLDHLKEQEAANQIRMAVNWSIKNELTSEDINKEAPLSCSMIGDLIALYISENGDVNLKHQDLIRETFYI